MKLLIDFLLIASLGISALLVSLLIIRLLRRRWDGFDRTRIDINASRLANSLSIDFLWLHDEDSVRKRLLALSARKFVRENFDFNAENTLTKEDVTSGLINEITDLGLVTETGGSVLVGQSES